MPVRACLVLVLSFLVPAVAGASQSNARVMLRVQPPGSVCGDEALRDVPCDQYPTAASTGVLQDVYLVIGRGDAASGISGLSCAIDYTPGSTGITIFGWSLCADLEFPGTGPHGSWPGPGSGNTILWERTGNCQRDPVPGFTSEGVHAIAGAFSVFAYSSDVLAVRPEPGTVPERIIVVDCSEAETALSPEVGGRIRFSDSGTVEGYNSCAGETEPPPPLPPDPGVMLHIGPAVGGCGRAPTDPGEIVTTAEAAADGSRSYDVFLLGSPSSLPPGPGLTGIQVGIEYAVDTGAGDGLTVWSWSSCSTANFPQSGWPDPGTGNTLTWTVEDCQVEPVVVGGFLYMTAYGPALMEVTPYPPTGKAAVANCLGGEINIELGPARVGWVSLGGAVRGADADGCNPALESCEDPVPVRPTTWGRIKSKYR